MPPPYTAMAAIAKSRLTSLLPSTSTSTPSPSTSVPTIISMTPSSSASPDPFHQQGRASLVLSTTSREYPADLSRVVNPSLAFATTLFFNSSHYNVQITVDDNESEERLLNRFRREVMRAGIMQECKRRRFFETNQEYRKRKAREAAKKLRRHRRPQAKFSKKKKRKKKLEREAQEEKSGKRR